MNTRLKIFTEKSLRALHYFELVIKQYSVMLHNVHEVVHIAMKISC